MCRKRQNSDQNQVQRLREQVKQLEQKNAMLSKSKEKFQLLFELAPEGFYLMDLKGNFVDGNAAAEKMSGYRRDELIGGSFIKLKLLGSADLLRAASLLEQNTLGHPAGPAEFTLIRKDGTRVPVEIRTHPVRIDRQLLILGIAQDITDRKSAEHQSNERTKELQAVFSLSEITGRKDITLDELYQEFVNILPESWQYPEIACARIVVGDNEFRTSNFTESPWMQSTPIKVDGSVVGRIEVRYLEERPEEGEGPFMNGERQLIDAVGQRLGQITKRKRMEDALRESTQENAFKAELLRKAPVIAAFHDRDQNIVWANQAYEEASGVSLQDIVGKKCYSVWNLPGPCQGCPVLTAIATGKSSEADLTPQNQKHWPAAQGSWLTKASPVRDEEGSIIGAIEVAIDITERKKAEEAQRQSEGKFRNLAKNTSDVIAIMDLQGTITYMSRSIEEMGFTEEEIEGANISQLLTPESYELAMNRLQKRLKGENINAPFEVGILNKSGIVVPFELNTSIITEEGELTGIEIVARNITERKQAEARTEKLLSQQRAVYRFSLALGALLDLHGICRLLADEIERLQGTNTLILSRFDRSTNLITPLYVMMDGTEMDVAELPTLPLAPEGEGMQSQVLRTGEPLYIPDWGAQEANLHTKYAVTDEKIVTSQIPDKSDRTSWTQSAVFLPLMIAGTPIGVMQVQSHRLDDFDDDDIVLLTGMASVAATGIERAELHTNVRAAFDGVVHALGVSTEMRDPYTAGHQRRVTELACAIAVELGLSSERQETLRVAGLLHDIGKMSVPAEILSRPGKLSSMEMDLLKSHARAGYEIVKGTSLPKDIADVILYHHERMDGSGYPEGLSGEAIPLESRILAVADVVEAMSSHRPYRAAHTLEEALREIETGAGTLYDSEVADACVRLFREERFHFSDKPG